MSFCSAMRLLACVTAVFWVAQAQDYCCLPDKFTILAAQVNGLELPCGHEIVQFNAVGAAIDFPEEKVALYIESFIGRANHTIYVIIDYKEGVAYLIAEGVCHMTTAQGVPEQCIPKTVNKDYTAALGDNEMVVDGFSYQEELPDCHYGDVSLIVSQKNCIPVSSTFEGSVSDERGRPINLVSSTAFVNYTEGVDPSYFRVPSFCPKSTSGKLLWTPEKSDVFSRLMGAFKSKPEELQWTPEKFGVISRLVGIVNSMITPTYQKK